MTEDRFLRSHLRRYSRAKRDQQILDNDARERVSFMLFLFADDIAYGGLLSRDFRIPTLPCHDWER